MRVELLAPAGSYDGMRAAFAAGADAVYIGGRRFGARAFADNLDEEQMKRAIDEAHICGKHLYLTVNTLIKQRELSELAPYLEPFYREGLDAVIVQDLGALQLIRREFPRLDIHASTQMTVTDAQGAAFLKELGVSRVVTAREMSLAEIGRIHEDVEIEIESFVHGALCYCYSGQCLMSSMIGGRSGNRGRCAQPCRLPYTLQRNGRDVSAHTGRYLLSPKDICTLELIPEMVECGIYSFKIEGRMKRPEYAAGVTRLYRKYIDEYLAHGKKDFRVSQEDLNELADLYNRGGFSKGYYHQHNGPKMMAMVQPNHWGTQAAKVIGASKRGVQLQALQTLGRGDVLELRKGAASAAVPVKEPVEAGKTFLAPVHTAGKAKDVLGRAVKGEILYRTRNEGLLRELEAAYVSEKRQEKINGKLILSKRKPAILTLSFREISVTASGEVPQQAQKRPVTEAEVIRQMKKTGATGYCFDVLEVEMEDDLFLPMQALNELRRQGIAALEESFLSAFRRMCGEDAAGLPDAAAQFLEADSSVDDVQLSEDTAAAAAVQRKLRFAVTLESRAAFEELLALSEIDRIDLDCAFFDDRSSFLRESASYVQRCHAAGKACFYVLPWIWRDRAQEYYCGGEAMAALSAYDGVFVRSLGQYRFLKELGYQKQMAAEHNLYTWNREAADFWRAHGMSLLTAPLELNERELRTLGCEDREILAYGYLPLMVSAQCPKKNTLGCDHTPETLMLRDRMQKKFAVRNHCDFCYNIIYNSAPLMLLEQEAQIRRLHPAGIRLLFTRETAQETLAVTAAYIQVFCGCRPGAELSGEFTKGHFGRGVE